MKNIIKGLETQIENLRTLIQKRDDKVDSMSENWQESEKCEEWENKTVDIESLTYELENIVYELKQLL